MAYTVDEYVGNIGMLLTEVIHRDKYVPFEEKIRKAKEIVHSAYYEDGDNGRKIFRFNSPAREMLTALALVDLYTDIDVGEDKLYAFNELNKAGFFEVFYDYMKDTDRGEKEYEEFISVIEWVEEDFVRNEYEIGGYISNQVGRITDVLTVALQPLVEQLMPLLNEQTMEELLKQFNK